MQHYLSMQTGLKGRLVEAGHVTARVGADMLLNAGCYKPRQGMNQAASQSSDTMSVWQVMQTKKR